MGDSDQRAKIPERAAVSLRQAAHRAVDRATRVLRFGKSERAQKSSEERPQVHELMRILDERPISYRLRFLGPNGAILERDFPHGDADAAIRQAANVSWPSTAVAIQIVDPDGHEIFERLKADL